ncbi:phosphatase PAP2 family protein [Thorsellia kenyensis]|uniref:undecaprenyl-diphosphate phosphatase n=1 Tax=Thorsellia kenyensis TaxID=1549888 RepID=A0ABV6CC20_9GAMM
MRITHLMENRLYFSIIFTCIFITPLLAILFNLDFSYFVSEQGMYGKSPLKFNQYFLTFLFVMTETVSFPYGVLTGSLVVLTVGRMLFFNKKQIIGLFAIISLCILVGLSIKMGIKQLTSEPRPYLIWLSMIKDGMPFDLTSYYELTRSNKEEVLKHIIYQPALESWNIPPYLAEHWIIDKSYRFPSGHTFYATFFAFFSAYILPKKNYGFAFLLGAWAVIVMLSRLYLGMHIPIDLVGGVIIALLATTLAAILVKFFLFRPFFTL